MKLWTVQEILTVTGLSESTVRRAIADSSLESRMIRGNRRIMHEWLIGWLQCDPIGNRSIIASVSKSVQSGKKTVTRTVKVQREDEPKLFEI